ncbi:FdhF/YdeP family oxidoreductase [Agrobacterium rosae]|uniref:FdhF/YdeP family oxidoreductase n=1 Tax=Agrobacterium rosae TaxID=1972867 RepID=A0AAE5S143_9HYPH|nr:FdhF/YdeP family oxidoreductase [Agrobacterium rosae]KAA3513126.1 formate dehydrogenase [Agrobacterium rosae]KAA3521385.1 formate dehydrogenase [Agrobacterium rosae]MCM2432765.1 FdhF/YdeP family oxidoreductase [Agrobacterium rosae]MDX8328165.1 FdhF/YdeP family oxidoreductase [Agrobacterium rosae]MQB48280.1 formate dehydrogenase [Agrobacterium rosae]
MADQIPNPESEGPSGGWGSVKSIARIYGENWPTPAALDTLAHLNKPGGVMCVSCAWPKPANYHPFEFCENGAKATLSDLTSARCTPDFWNDHTVAELRDWKDHDLEKTGRLTHPMRYDHQTDRYVEVDWEEAFADIGQRLKALPRESAVFYSSGHAGLEASYLYALMARAYGNNNLPQSSNMCHETTSVGLNKVIGSPVGTIVWEDLEKADAFFFFGQNPGSNSPRFLHPLQEAKKRGAHIVTFNPVVEQGLVSFVNPQSPVDMLTGHETTISDEYLQVKAGGDIAAILGLCKVVMEADDAAIANAGKRVIDVDFIAEHTVGFDKFIQSVRDTGWPDIERESGLTEAALRSAGDIYVRSERVIGVYGMGLTQHSQGALNVAMLVNLLLLRGNIGREGAGCCPVRGHSNVQGQRTVGIAEKTKLIPMDKLKQLFDFDPPMEDGTTIVDAVKGLMAGSIKAFICLGGNLVRAVPDQKDMEQAWSRQELTVMISTKLNRSHLFPGANTYILPCLSRLEIDSQATGPQAVTTEDSFSHISGSLGKRTPASAHLKSELAIVTSIAKAALAPNPKLKWDEWTGNYGLVRDLIEFTYPKDFKDYNARMFQPGGFYRGNNAHKRIWNTDEKKAVFTAPHRLNALSFDDADGRFRLVTMRSNDQFNTTIYGYSDRFRGIEGTRDVVLMCAQDMAAAGLHEGQKITLVSDFEDGKRRELGGLSVRTHNLPRGTIGAYYPEANTLISIDHHDELSKTPASKAIPVRIETGQPSKSI